MKTLPAILALAAAPLFAAETPATATEAAGADAAASSVSFDRYQVILDRKPFGDLSAPVQPPPPPPPPNDIPKFFRLCSIVKEDNGEIRVGILDTRTQKALSLMPGGPAEGGLQVNKASYEEETAELQFGSEIQLLNLKAGTATPVGPGGAAAVTAAPPGGAPPMPSPPSYADRRRERLLQTHEPVAAPQPKYTGQALQDHLQKYQMEVIRQGLPPLPIPLTKDQDDQLVKEGILPAQ